MEILDIIKQYGPYVCLPLVVAFLTQGLKSQIKFFKTVLGLRIIHFVPLVLGVLGGLLLPEDTWQNKILYGGALGSVSLFIYKFITVTLAKKTDLETKIARNSVPSKDVPTE